MTDPVLSHLSVVLMGVKWVQAAEQFFADLRVSLQLVSQHRVAVLVTCIATFVLVASYTPSLRIDFGGQHWNAFVYYGVIPLLALMLLTKQHPFRLGLQLGDVRFWVPASLLYLAVALPITIIGTLASGMNDFYNSESIIWTQYLFETALYMLGWEYLYRGFLITGLRDSLKEGAILVQMIPFTLLHLGKPDIEIISCIFSGLIWGYICYRGNSFWPAFLIHLIINVTVKLIAQ